MNLHAPKIQTSSAHICPRDIPPGDIYHGIFPADISGKNHW